MRGNLYALCVFILCSVLVASAAAQPTSFTVPFYQAQFQWRATSWGGPFGAWSYTYQNWATSDDFRLTGSVLHATWAYSPSVTDLAGASHVYVYDKENELWIDHEGTVKYTSPYSGLTITEFWRGYLQFHGVPSATTFVHGVAYQWGYVFMPQSKESTVRAKYPNAIWDDAVEAWLVGFSIYLFDAGTQNYSISFEFVEPIPANVFNPLGL